MSDHADSGEYGLHTNWENCEGGLCCDEALAIMEALVAERDEAKAQFWQQRHEWAAATGRNQEIIDGLLAERDDTERTNGPWKCLAETETKLAAAEKERDVWMMWLVEALHHNAEEIRLREALHPDVLAERRHQDTVWGLQEHSDPIWLAILTEEVGEAAEGILHETFNDATGETRAEVVQIAAVALAWLQCIDARAALGEDA